MFTFQLHLVDLTPLCTDKAVRTRCLHWEILMERKKALFTLAVWTGDSGKESWLFSNLPFPEKEQCLCVCGFLWVCVCVCNDTQSKGFVSKCAHVWSSQSRDNPNQAPRLDGGQGGERGRVRRVWRCCHSSELWQEPPIHSIDVQDVTLFQAKPGLVLVKKALEGLDVHCMINIHHLLSWVLNFWHSDWLPNCNRTGEC